MHEMTNWFAFDIKPIHVGYYEVRNDRIMHWNSKGRLVGMNKRYWDGVKWLTFDPECFLSEPSIMGTHRTQQWRGFTTEQQGV